MNWAGCTKASRELRVRDGNTKALTEEFYTPEESKNHFEKVSTERNERTQEEQRDEEENRRGDREKITIRDPRERNIRGKR